MDTVQQLLAFARNRGGSLSFSEAQRLFHQGLHLKPEEEQEEPSEHPWLHPWLQSSDAELASDCPLADYGGYLSSDDDLDLHPNFRGERMQHFEPSQHSKAANGQTEDQYSRAELIFLAFIEMDRGAKGFLGESDLKPFAELTGFEGTESDWKEEFHALRQQCGGEINFRRFEQLVNDQSECGCYASDAQLQDLLILLKEFPGGFPGGFEADTFLNGGSYQGHGSNTAEPADPTPPDPTAEDAHRPLQQLKAENAALRERLASFEASAPAFVQTAEWLRTELPKLLAADYWQPTQVEIPILALRFTHANVNASLAFGDSHENNQENILKLFDQMFRNRVRPHEVEPLCVKLPQSLDDKKGIRSRNNRRLLALRALQSCRLETCIMVPCRVHSHSYYMYYEKFRSWFNHGDDGGPGWSIRSREGRSHHRGVIAFNNADAAIKGLKNLAMRREQAGSSFENERTFSLSELCEKLKKKQAGWDWEEETLTLQSEADPEWSSNPWAGWQHQ